MSSSKRSKSKQSVASSKNNEPVKETKDSPLRAALKNASKRMKGNKMRVEASVGLPVKLMSSFLNAVVETTDEDLVADYLTAFCYGMCLTGKDCGVGKLRGGQMDNKRGNTEFRININGEEYGKKDFVEARENMDQDELKEMAKIPKDVMAKALIQILNKEDPEFAANVAQFHQYYKFANGALFINGMQDELYNNLAAAGNSLEGYLNGLASSTANAVVSTHANTIALMYVWGAPLNKKLVEKRAVEVAIISRYLYVLGRKLVGLKVVTGSVNSKVDTSKLDAKRLKEWKNYLAVGATIDVSGERITVDAKTIADEVPLKKSSASDSLVIEEVGGETA